VALGKMLNLGGMENSLPKTTQNPNRFRVARNVQPSVDGRIIPRSSYETQSGQPGGIAKYKYLKDYDTSVFKMAEDFNSIRYEYYLNNNKIPSSYLQGGGSLSSPNSLTDLPLSAMSFRKNNTLYLLNPSLSLIAPSSFFKYDGVEITGCGSSQPRFNTVGTGYDSAGTTLIKVIQHRVYFDSNEPVSESVTFPILNATNSITIQTNSAITPIVGQGNINVSPSNLVVSNQNDMTDLYFFGTATYNSSTQDYTIATTETNIISQDQVGCYVFVGNSASLNTYWTSAQTLLGENNRLIALKVKSVNPLVLDGLSLYKMPVATSEWLPTNLRNPTFAGNITFGFRKIFSVWASSTLNGNYVLRATNPVFPESGISRTFTVDTSATSGLPPAAYSVADYLPVVVGFNLGDWYDVNSRKLCISTNYPFGGNFTGITSYQDQILWWNDDLIFFSDPNLGGSIEHPSAGSFIRVGDSEYGKVVSCCGTQDYFIVSRERKNYFINGNLATGNYRVQDIADIEVGAWCNNGLINIKDSIVMINATGVWQIQGGGRVSHLSKQIPKNFSIYDSLESQEDVAFRLNGFSIFPIIFPYVDTGLEIAFDEFREYLVFCQRSSPGTPVLVLHTKTGEFYEWNGFEEVGLRGMTFVLGVLYYGTVDTVGYTAVVKNETPLLGTQDYAETYPIKLYSTWLTANEPSLEKQLLQLKMFGAINNNGSSSINVVHFKDWNLTKITNSPYIPDLITQYSHLKRLNSDKVLAASVGLEVDTSGVTFALESMEIEFNAIQQGIKR